MRVRIFAFIKNEQHLLERWLDHIISFCPGWCIHIIDNKSDDDTIDILQEYKKNYGIHTYTCPDFSQKGDLITEKILRYKSQPGLSIPLDGDEFISLYDKETNTVCTNGDTIKDYLNDIYYNSPAGIYRTAGWLNSVPEQETYSDPVKDITKFRWELTDKNLCKKIVRTEDFKSIDLGYHTAISYNREFVQTNIAYLHYHDTGRDRRMKRCEEIIKKHGLDIDTIRKQIKPKGDKPIQTGNNFSGVMRVNEYLDSNNWEYNTSDKFDLVYRW